MPPARHCIRLWRHTMHDMKDVFSLPPFKTGREEKQAMLRRYLWSLTRQHYESCAAYRGILDAFGVSPDSHEKDCQHVPFLPVSLFKKLELKSIPQEEVVKVLTSSGTTGQTVSRIFLDKYTAINQQKALAATFTAFTGASRMPMLILDTPSVLKDRYMFSARGAGILGFSLFGTDRTYALDENMNLDFPAIESFLERHAGQRILLFGFTFMIWQHVCKALHEAHRRLDFSRGLLIHGGGWKKLAGEVSDPAAFRQALNDVCGLSSIHDYYGMVEQTGCIALECEYGHLHTSIFADIIMRRPRDLSVCPTGERGIVQTLSILPASYPGHSLLTEDEGTLLGEDDYPCGRLGKYFVIHGRLKNAEIRGCSDTYAATYTRS